MPRRFELMNKYSESRPFSKDARVLLQIFPHWRCGLAQGHCPLFRSFPHHDEIPALKIDIGQFEPDQLADPETRGIEQFQHGFIAQPDRRGGLGLVQQRINVETRKRLGETFPPARRLQVFRRVRVRQSVDQQKFMKSPDRGQAPRSGRCGDPGRR